MSKITSIAKFDARSQRLVPLCEPIEGTLESLNVDTTLDRP